MCGLREMVPLVFCVGLLACEVSPSVGELPTAASVPVSANAMPSPTTERTMYVTPEVPLTTPRAFPSGAAFTPAPPILPTPVDVAVQGQARAAMIADIEQMLNNGGSSASRTIPRRIGSPVLDPRYFYAYVDLVLEARSAGEMPLVLTSLRSGLIHSGLFVFSFAGQRWNHFEIDVRDKVGGEPAFVSGLEQTRDGRVELGIGWNCGGCSFSAIEFVLLRFENGAWSTLWQSVEPEWHGMHGELTFVAGLNRLAIRYSSYSPPDNKNVFGESNAGPHRWFVDTWQREGDRYHLVQTVSLPSTYKTAVEFVYALMQGDDAGAGKWTTSPSLVRQARLLGFGSLARLRWADPDDERGTVRLWVNDAPQNPIPQVNPRYILHMTRPGPEWLITSIETMP